MSAMERITQAIEAIKRGEMVVMIDDEDRENEGDLVYASVFSTPEHVNFMASHAKGLICVATSAEIAQRLALAPMVARNDSSYETAFTVSVDAKGASTGISAYERDMTIKILANPLSQAQELVRPGHIFPLIAKNGGVLIRTGHTEGSVDLCRLAGLAPSAVICEIMKENGEMARRDDLDVFCHKHALKTVFISDLVEYRLQNETLLRQTKEELIDFDGIAARKYQFEDHLGHLHTAIMFGEKSQTMAVKVHNIIPDIDLILDNIKYRHLVDAMEYLKKEGGLLLFIDSAERHSKEMKEYGIGALMLKAFDVKNIRLLASSNRTDFVGIHGFGLQVVEQIVL
ncbi:MAG: 3,4-dihydroxy-2-butanone 4-phosphate synthase [Sulfuricurvum sp. PC08-66]|nr:MAG: 3,4-dihydroxy-2-butanone 4-phosphate synthase [Sulfuricurvum sp. PC08-66]